jgi:hypothetical protein
LVFFACASARDFVELGIDDVAIPPRNAAPATTSVDGMIDLLLLSLISVFSLSNHRVRHRAELARGAVPSLLGRL